MTGGGIAGNLARALPDGLGAVVDPDAWERPEVFGWLAEAGRRGGRIAPRVQHRDRILRDRFRPRRESGDLVIGEIVEGGGVTWA